MSVLALVSEGEKAHRLITWAATFAMARQAKLIVLCWSYSPTVEHPLLQSDEENSSLEELVSTARGVIASLPARITQGEGAVEIEIRRDLRPDLVSAALEGVRAENAELLIAAGSEVDYEGKLSETTDQLLRRSPCHVGLLYGDDSRSCTPDQVLVAATDSRHDRVAVSIGARMAENCGSLVTVANAEDDTGDEAIEVGARELKRMMRDARVEESERLVPLVIVDDNALSAFAGLADQRDIVILGSDHVQNVGRLLSATTRPTICVIKRAPPLRPWHKRGGRKRWIPPLHPADFADLVQQLRQGSRWNVDFIIMLSAAAAIASLGLLQDSPAVVIGSMLLAPLMTPMIGSGLSLAQANPKLASTCFRSIFSGSAVTLMIGFLVGISMPGESLTPQVLARGEPNLLDLFIALASALAAAYAIARPNLVGAAAGVAIATALVPPLCSVGIALAYQRYLIAFGATVLFVTNAVAIILAAGITFRMMGVTAARSTPRQKRWVYRVTGTLALTVLLLAIPLERSLDIQIERGKPQPIAYPVTRSVADAVRAHVRKDPGVKVMLMGRPAVEESPVDVVIYLSSPRPLPRGYGEEIVNIIRREMEDEELIVEVFCVPDAWEDPDTPE